MKIVGKVAWISVAIMLPDVNGNDFTAWAYSNESPSFTDWERVRLYRNGVLVWGTEP